MHTLRVVFLMMTLMPSSILLPWTSSSPFSSPFEALQHSMQSPLDIADCSEFDFISCNTILQVIPSDGDYKGTVVIMDDGLSRGQWFDIEDTGNANGLYLDIIGYVVPDQNGNPTVYGQDGVDSLAGVTDQDLGYSSGENHGIRVLSAFATIARRAKVIFVNMYDFGFEPLDEGLWQWLYDNVDTYNIKVVSMSFNDYNSSNISPAVDNLMVSLYQKGVVMVSAIGNDDQNRGNLVPQLHQYVYAIGSIDHKNKGIPLDSDFYSKKGYRSGSSRYATLLPEYCRNPYTLPFCSSYGANAEGDPEALDFLMPGNYVPVSTNFDNFVEGFGTSFSTAYFAAAVLIVVYAYWLGYYSIRGRDAKISVTRIIDLLKFADRDDGWSQKEGWGYVDLWNAFSDALDLGMTDGRNAGSGGGCGINCNLR